MSARLERPSVDAALGNHEGRLRQIEGRTTGPWIYVGAVGAPAFENSWTNVGGSTTPLRFRWIYDRGVEIQGSITGGALNTVVFTLPSDYRLDAELRGLGVADSGAAVPFKILATGEVVCLPPSAGSGGAGGGSAGVAFVTVNIGDWLSVETTGANPNTVTTVAASYSSLGISLIANNDIVIGTTGVQNLTLDAGSIFLNGTIFSNGNDPIDGVFLNQRGGYFVNNGYFLYTGDGFEADSTSGVYFSASGDRIGLDDFSAVGVGGLKISSTFNGVQVSCNGILVFEIRNDGTVHILTGGVIHADL